MVIYMKHPIHGTKVAVAEDEAKADEKNGWVRFDIKSVAVSTDATPEVQIKVMVEPKPEEVSERAELTKQYVDKFGEKPHWKMSVQSIKDKLCQPPSTS